MELGVGDEIEIMLRPEKKQSASATDYYNWLMSTQSVTH